MASTYSSGSCSAYGRCSEKNKNKPNWRPTGTLTLYTLKKKKGTKESNAKSRFVIGGHPGEPRTAQRRRLPLGVWLFGMCGVRTTTSTRNPRGTAHLNLVRSPQVLVGRVTPARLLNLLRVIAFDQSFFLHLSPPPPGAEDDGRKDADTSQEGIVTKTPQNKVLHSGGKPTI